MLLVNSGISSIEGQIEEYAFSAFKEINPPSTQYNCTQLVNVYLNIIKEGLRQYPPNKIVSLAMEIASGLMPQKIYDDKNKNVLLINGQEINMNILKILRDMGRKIITWQIDDPYLLDRSVDIGKICEHIFTVDSSALSFYRESGCKNAHWLPLAFPEKYRDVVYNANYSSDVCLIGTPFAGSKRVRIVDELAATLASVKARIIGSHVIAESWQKNLKNYEMLKNKIIEAFMAPDEAVKYYKAAKININIHRDSYGYQMDMNNGKVVAKSPNDRVFIIAGLGGFQLVDDTRPDLGELFEIGKEIVTFQSIEDLKEKIIYYLGHEAEREKIAKAGQIRALKDHTYRNRVKKILEVVGEDQN